MEIVVAIIFAIGLVLASVGLPLFVYYSNRAEIERVNHDGR